MNSYDSGVRTNLRVEGMLSKKLSKVVGGIDERATKAESGGHSVDDDNIPLSAKIQDSIGKKLIGYVTRRGGYFGEYAADKYMGMPISDIMQEERKTGNLLRNAESKLNELVDKHYQSAYKSAMKVGGTTERSARDYATGYVESNIIGSWGESDAEKKAHAEFIELDAEVTQLRVEHNATLVAKQSYIDKNADLIREMQEKRRRDELINSGLLSELGLAEAPQKKEKPETENSEEAE